MKVAPVSSHRGAILLMAMLAVALVSALISTALWRQSELIQIESAERQIGEPLNVTGIVKPFAGPLAHAIRSLSA